MFHPSLRSPHATRVLALMACLIVDRSASTAEESEKIDVFVNGTEGYHTFRIPAVIATKEGTLLAFCEGRKNSRADHGDIDLVLRRSEDGGRSWGPLEPVYEEGGDEEITIGNPCPVVDQFNGRIWMPFTRDNDDVFVIYSDDDGHTWAEPRKITDEVKRPVWTWYATGPGIGVQLQRGPHAGRLVIPCDHREPFEQATAKFSHVFFSDDHGQTWKLGESVSPHTDECQVVELTDGRLQINMRNYWERDGKRPEKGRMRAIATSADGGESWSELQFDSTLIEPVCQASLIRSESGTEGQRGERLLFSNPASRTDRHLLTVRFSPDGGQTWPRSKVLHEGPAAYSSLIEQPDGSIGCLYEAGENHAYERIVFERFSLDDLMVGEVPKP
ncbi:sialidase family protein [soil metagenome]